VGQWDWERVITREQRTVAFLKQIVSRIYAAMRRTEYMVCEMYPQIKPFLAHDLVFIHSEELRQRYPDLTPKEREHAICREYGSVFIIDPETGLAGLNGDLLVWDNVLGRSIELSSMGIRVDKDALLRQLALSGQEQRKELYFHKRLLEGSLPLSIGGGIGQSRLCMLYLQKAHIGEIQASIWPQEMREECVKAGMPLI
jgi:aspartate--ammonia ligase